MKQPSNDVPNNYSQNGQHLCAKQTIQEFYKFAAMNECDRHCDRHCDRPCVTDLAQ
jgi:hypothetical protein